MKLLISFALAFALFSTAHSLDCYQCIPVSTAPCSQTQITCPSQQTRCGSATVGIYMPGLSSANVIKMKSCAAPGECLSGSVNFGTARTVINTKCCDSNLCNTQDSPALTDDAANGQQCFTCEGEDCTKTLKCLGSEDRCIKTSVTTGGQKLTMKGCASQTVCGGALNAQIGNVAVGMSCCQGNLCNGALRVGQSVLFLLLVPLASVVLFH